METFELDIGKIKITNNFELSKNRFASREISEDIRPCKVTIIDVNLEEISLNRGNDFNWKL